jgi:hypothetical protein
MGCRPCTPRPRGCGCRAGERRHRHRQRGRLPSFVPDLLNPSRGYVEDWLGRKEARAAARETRRFHSIYWLSLIGAGTGIVAIWPVVRDSLAGGR